MSGEPCLIQARVSYEPAAGGEPPSWFCEVGSGAGDAFIQGEGSTPLAAAMQAAEQATALWVQLRWPDVDPEVMATSAGRTRLTEDGAHR